MAAAARRTISVSMRRSYPGLDLPGSALLDTLLLPLSIAAELGIGLQVWGGN